MEQLRELPKGWVWTNVNDLSILIQYGYTASASKDNIGPKFLRITDIQNNTVIWENVPFCTINESDKNRYLLNQGDIVFARTGATVGKSFIIQGKIPESIFASYLIRIVPAASINKKYIYFFFKTNLYWEQISNKKIGIGQPNVNGSSLGKISLPVSPLQEQNRIVTKIEELFTNLDAGIESLKKVKAQLKRYRQAVLKHAFEGKLTEEWREANKNKLEPASVLLERVKEERKKGETRYKDLPTLDTSDLYGLPEGWVWTRLQGISELISGQHILSEDYNFDMQGLPYLTGPADFGFMYPFISKWTEKPKAISKENDILITVKGAGVGKTNILNFVEAAISRQLMAVRVTDIDHKYIFFYVHLNFSLFQKLGAGSTVPGIDREAILNILIPIPSLLEQNAIVEEIERYYSIADEVEKAVEQSLLQSNRLRQSILKRAFEGKLVPQDPNDEPAEKLLERIKAEKQIKKSKFKEFKFNG